MNSIDLIKAATDKFYATFSKSVRDFMFEDRYLDEDENEERNMFSDRISKPSECIKIFDGIVNVLFAYETCRYRTLTKSERKTMRVTADGKHRRYIDRIFGVYDDLYDKYDASDDVVRYVVFNSQIAAERSTEFAEKIGIAHDGGEQSDDNLMPILKYMAYLRAGSSTNNARVFDAKARAVGSEKMLQLLLRLIDYSSFMTNVEIVFRDANQALAEAGSVSFVCNGTDYPSFYQLARINLAKRGTDSYNYANVLLRRIECLEDNDGVVYALNLVYSKVSYSEKSLELKYLIGEETAAEAATSELNDTVDSVEDLFYQLTLGGSFLMKQAIPFSVGFTNFKYYGDLAAAIIDALDESEMRDDNGVGSNYFVTNVMQPLVSRNIELCRDECICNYVPAGLKVCTNKGHTCKWGETIASDVPEGCENCENKPCSASDQNVPVECVKFFNWQSVLTALFAVSGCKKIVPIMLEKYTSDLKGTIKSVNTELKRRFPDFDENTVNKMQQMLYAEAVRPIRNNLQKDYRNLSDSIKKEIQRITIRTYTEALVNQLERINSNSVAETTDSQKFYGTNIEDKCNILGRMQAEIGDNNCEKAVWEEAVEFARDALKYSLKTVLAYYEGLAACSEEQLKYELQVADTVVMSGAEAGSAQNRIVDAFKRGVLKMRQQIEGNKTVKELLSVLSEAMTSKEKEFSNKRADIELLLGRDIMNWKVFTSFFVDVAGNLLKCKYENFDGTHEILYDLDAPITNRYDACAFLGKIKDTLLFLINDYGAIHGSKNRMDADKVGCYPKVLTYSSSTLNCDQNRICYFIFSGDENSDSDLNLKVKRQRRVLTYFSYEINNKYYCVLPKSSESGQWLINPILIKCTDFESWLFGDAN